MQPIHGTEAENQNIRIDEESNLPVLPSGKKSIPTEEDMDVFCCTGIKIDDDNDPEPENANEQKEQQKRNG